MKISKILVAACIVLLVAAIAHSQDGTWAEQTSGITNDLYGVAFANDSTGWAVGQSGAIRYTTNGGATEWTDQSGVTSSALSAVTFVNDSAGWIVGNSGIILHTTNAGTTWTIQSSAGQSLFGVAFTNDSTGWTVGDWGTIRHTTNAGTTWTAQSSGETCSFYGVTFTNDSTGWAVGQGGRIRHTTNAGINWTSQSTPTEETLFDVAFTDDTTGWAVGNNGTILHTVNAGTLWIEQDSDTNVYLRDAVFTDASTGWVVGHNGVILHTINNGTTWTAQDNPTTEKLTGVAFIDPCIGWAVGENGVILSYDSPATIIKPNGSEEWRISELDTIRWAGDCFKGGVQIELNRDYPAGAWVVLVDSTGDDSEETLVVTGPASDHCRARVSARSDIYWDISDADFRIISHISLLSPNGGEIWEVLTTDTARWTGAGFDSVKIELNRDYPEGEWEILVTSTENDSEETVSITPPASDSCRIRISSLQDTTIFDTSDADFSIIYPPGYLALVNPAEPGTPVEDWNAGTFECPDTTFEIFHLKNFGTATIIVYDPEPPDGPHFSRETDCASVFGLAPDEMSACTLAITYNPQSEGIHLDTLRIETNAENADPDGYVRIPLTGEQIRTPDTVQQVITIEGGDMRLSWDSVTVSIYGCPIDVTHYLVFYSPTFEGPYYYHGYTADTTYVHVGVAHYEDTYFYNITATTAPLPLLQSLPTDVALKREEVLRLLKQ